MAASGQLKELSLKGRDMIELDEYSTEEIQFLLDSAIEIKRKQKNGKSISR